MMDVVSLCVYRVLVMQADHDVNRSRDVSHIDAMSTECYHVRCNPS
jgi:hypothetical protein